MKKPPSHSQIEQLIRNYRDSWLAYMSARVAMNYTAAADLGYTRDNDSDALLEASRERSAYIAHLEERNAYLESAAKLLEYDMEMVENATKRCSELEAVVEQVSRMVLSVEQGDPQAWGEASKVYDLCYKALYGEDDCDA